jgi:hypothetical protein
VSDLADALVKVFFDQMEDYPPEGVSEVWERDLRSALEKAMQETAIKLVFNSTVDPSPSFGRPEGMVVMESLAVGQGDKGFSQSDLDRVMDEVQKAHTHGRLADLILAGEMFIFLGEDGTIEYGTRPEAKVLQEGDQQ